MTLSGKKINLFAVALVILLGIVFIIAAKSVMIGPGVPPAKYLPRLLIPEGDIYSADCSGPGDMGMKYFSQTGTVHDENYGQFPTLTPYSSYGLFRSEKTNNTMVISVWYFDSEADFRTAQHNMLAFLEQNGTDGEYDLETGSPTMCTGTGTGNSTPNQLQENPKTVRTTKFTGNFGSGVFLAISRPLMPGRDDFFIEYAGTVNSTNPSGDASEVRDLVALNNRPYNLKGTIEELQ
jgi:hypothetical protein